MTPSSYTRFKKELQADDTVRIVNYLYPWHTRTTTIEGKTLHGIQVIANEHGRHGGEQMASHISWPMAKHVELIDNGVAFLAERRRPIWEWSEEYGGPVRNDLYIEPGESFMTLTKPDYSEETRK